MRHTSDDGLDSPKRYPPVAEALEPVRLGLREVADVYGPGGDVAGSALLDTGNAVRTLMKRSFVDQSEKDTELVQNLGRLQPFTVVFPQECVG
jgi:hypothetical protein